MKRLIISVSFLLVCIGIGIFSTKYVDQKCTEALDRINYAIVHKDNIASAQEAIENTHTKWNKSKKILCLLVNKRDVLEVESDLTTLLFYINSNNVESFIITAADCTNKITNISAINKLSLDNIL